ncbi:hypothetical protein AB1046_12935 [Promicromonospora sp. Populi]|uniref:hypothetical protein n=1 Tax=Promicromonospora sp. Populi TaxID=3239420 RepID=UPI0034E2AAA5
MSVYAPAARSVFPQSVELRRTAPSAAARRPVAQSPRDREAQRREIERAARQRAQAERVRDNLAARHPLSLR